MSQETDPPAGGDENKRPVFAFPQTLAGVGMAVFFMASIAALVIVVARNVGLGAPDEDFRFLRSIEIVISIGALGLIASFLGGQSNAIAVFFAFLVIAALVVPARDIVRFALLATGSDRDVEDYYGSSSVAINLTGRVPDMASNIVRGVVKDLSAYEIEVPVALRDQLIDTVTDAVSRDQVLTIIDRVKSRGAFELLGAIGSDEGHEEFLYRYRQHDRLAADVAFLRQEDLITVAYDDMSSIALTELGRRVLSSATQYGQLLVSERFDVPDTSGLFGIGCDDVVFSELDEAAIAETPEAGGAPFTTDISIEPDPLIFAWRVLPGEVGVYEVRVDPMPWDDATPGTPQPGGTDPVLSILRYSGDRPVAEMRRSCEQVATNDDGPQGLGSLIERRMEPGHYLIGITPYMDSVGPAALSIARR